MTRVLQLPTQTANLFLYISDWSLSQNDILASLEKITGERWARNRVSSAAKAKEGKEKMVRDGDATGLYDLVKFSLLAGGYGGDYERDEVVANGLLGLPRVDLDEVVKGVLVESGQPVL